jgi:hypothetical protein
VSAPGDGGLRVEVQFLPELPRAESGT